MVHQHLVQRACVPPCKRRALVHVRDDGRGIAPELLPHVFDLFVQADQSLDRVEGGLGIGLNLARRLVELHGGSIAVHSDGAGRGTEFTVRLPAHQDTGVADALTTTRTPEPRARRVLLIDDNTDAANLLADALRLSGHAVETLHEPLKAVERAAAFKPDVLLIDIGLPGIDGFELAQRLRSLPATAAARFIALTGYGGDEDRERSAAAGFDYHVQKPADLEEIEHLLSQDMQPANSAPPM